MMRTLAAIIFFWPIYSVRNCLKFAGNEKPGSSKVKTFASFLPVLLISNILWAVGWAVALWIAGFR